MPINPNSAQPENWYSGIFARIYDPFMQKMEERVLQKRRKSLLEHLTGTILEVGAGTGANFQHYNQQAHVIAIEPAGMMLQHAAKMLSEEQLSASFRLIQAGIGDDAVQEAIPEDGLDAVVFTLVLCTIPDAASALLQCVEWLKPGGKMVMLEHIASTDPWGYRIQTVINPVWKHLAEGCNLNRHTDALVRSMGLQLESEEYFTKALPFYKAVWVKPG
jgi:ubiquinone/menaquinone biosynthesis C-methylase UbiE